MLEYSKGGPRYADGERNPYDSKGYHVRLEAYLEKDREKTYTADELIALIDAYIAGAEQ